MPAKRLSMRKIKDVLRLCWGQQQGIGRCEAGQGVERHLELAVAPFGFDGAQG